MGCMSGGGCRRGGYIHYCVGFGAHNHHRTAVEVCLIGLNDVFVGQCVSWENIGAIKSCVPVIHGKDGDSICCHDMVAQIVHGSKGSHIGLGQGNDNINTSICRDGKSVLN